MAIELSDLTYSLTGGQNNTDPAMSLGGRISDDGTLSRNASMEVNAESLFPDVLENQSEAGITQYRCIALTNRHATLTYLRVFARISQQSTSPTTSAEIGIDPAGVVVANDDNTAVAVANETIAPQGVAFSAPTTFEDGISIGSIPPGQTVFIWIKWTTNAGTSAINDDVLRVQVRGGTAQ